MNKFLKTISYILILNCLFLIINTSYGQNSGYSKPKLIIGIVIDQMRYEYIYRYWNNFGEKGFKKLINNGALCTNAETGFLLNQSASSHASISTGAFPSTHGIISDEWYSRLSNKIIKCAVDPNTETIGSDSEDGRRSPIHLFSGTIGDEMKLNNKKSKIIGISLKDHSAIFMAGHIIDAAYWFDSETGNWISSSFYMNGLPTWVNDFNDKKLPDSYIAREWNLLLPKTSYSSGFEDNNLFEVGFGTRNNSFPYDLKKLQKRSLSNDYEILKSTPFGNTLTTDFVLSAIEEGELGQDEITDLLMVSFSSTDYIGHLFGPHSFEIEDAFIRLDQEIGHFIDIVENSLGKENILIFLTSSHGVANIPKQMEANKMHAGFFRYRNAVALLKSYLNAIYGHGDWIKYYYNQQLYLNRSLIEDTGISLLEIQNTSANFLVEFDGVANVLVSSVLQSTDFSHGVFNKMQNSFNQKLSGDLLINLKPGWTEETDLATNHNSAYEYDVHVPLIWYGWKIQPKTIQRKVSLTDIAPTLANFLHIQRPNSSCGITIYELIELW
ncbi:alkaline phosphatase family protein [Bacteroidota bacterium]